MKMTDEEKFLNFVERAKKIHDNKYSYPEGQKIHDLSNDYVTVVCPIHGEFKVK